MSPTNLGQLPNNQPVPTGLCQIKRGVGGEIQWNNTVPAQPMQDGGGNWMTIAINPARPGWWVIRAETIWRTPDAVWTYWHWGVLLDPAGADGNYDDRNHICVHSAIGWSESVINTAFKLNAGTLYYAHMWWPNSTKGWNQIYFTGAEYHYIMGEFYEDT